MVKKNKNKNKQKKQTNLRRKNGVVKIQVNRGTKRQNSHAGLSTKLARSIVDPFQNSSCVPDGSNNTGCFSVRGINNLSTGAGGSAVSFCLALDPRNLLYADSGSTAATYTLSDASTWTSATNIASITAFYARYRPVSAALRFTYAGADQTNGGTCIVAQMPAAVTPFLLNGDNVSSAVALASNAEMFAVKQGGIVSWRPEDAEDFSFRNFYSSSATLDLNGSDVPWLFLGCNNLSAGGVGVVMVEWVVHFEGQFKDLTFQPGGFANSPPTAEPGWFEKAMNVAKSIRPIIIGLGNMASWISSQGNFINYPVPNSARPRITGITSRGPKIEEIS